MPSPMVSLITDFGLRDEYVGVLKAVILSYDAKIRIVDITHLVPPQQVHTAAHLLKRAYPFFPPGTVHLAVVDPGVGSDRPVLAIHADGHFFVGPDNGVFSPVLHGAKILTVYRITESRFFLPRVSHTFHGRDIMAPVAARLATGLAVDRVGPRIALQDCFLSGPGPCSVFAGVLHGEIVHVDRFGNLCTNISRGEMERFSDGKRPTIRVGEAAEMPITAFCTSYSGQPRGALLALYDSHDLLEIAESMGNAAARLQAATGTRVLVLRD